MDDDPYQVQEQYLAGLQQATGDTRAGFKLGLTTPESRLQFGGSTPIYGELFSAGIFASGHGFELKTYVVEPEVFLRFPTGVPGGADIDEVRSLATVGLSLEVVEIPEVMPKDWITIVRENGHAQCLVVGDGEVDGHVLDEWPPSMDVYVDGEFVAREAAGPDDLDHPLDNALWLVQQLAGRGREINPGTVVTTGLIPPWIFVTSPCEISVSSKSLGSVSARFGLGEQPV